MARESLESVQARLAGPLGKASSEPEQFLDGALTKQQCIAVKKLEKPWFRIERVRATGVLFVHTLHGVYRIDPDWEEGKEEGSDGEEED